MIETQRLLLTKPTLEDVEPTCAMWANPEVTRFISGKILERRQAWINLLYTVGHWHLLGYGFWTVREKETGAFVGQVGYQKFVRGIDASKEHLPEAGWALDPAFWGRGYAEEAVRAFLGWGDATLKGEPTMAIVKEDNLPSLRLAAKFGFSEVSRVTYAGSTVVLLQRDRPT